METDVNAARVLPWREAGTPDTGPWQDFSAARDAAGLGWDPVDSPACYRTADETTVRARFAAALPGADSTQLDQLMAIHCGSIRTDSRYRRISRSDNPDISLSYQAGSYHTIPNTAFGLICDALIQAAGDSAGYETGGCFDDGRHIWMLIRFGAAASIPADRSLTFPFFAVSSRHDGTGSCSARLAAIRDVSASAFSASGAEGSKASTFYSFVHRGSWQANLDQAEQALAFGRGEIRKYEEAMNGLLAAPVSSRQEELWVCKFTGARRGRVTDRVARNIEASRHVLRGILASPTVEGAGIRGTAGGLALAAAELLDWHRKSHTPSSWIRRALLTPDPAKARAVVLAREAATAS